MQALLIKHFILWSFSSGPWSSFQSDTRLYGNHLSWPLYISSWTSFFSQCNPQFLLGSYVFVFPFYKLEVFLIRSIIAAMILLFSHGDWTVICESGLGIPAAREILGRQSPKSLRQRGPGIKTGTCSAHMIDPWLAVWKEPRIGKCSFYLWASSTSSFTNGVPIGPLHFLCKRILTSQVSRWHSLTWRSQDHKAKGLPPDCWGA